MVRSVKPPDFVFIIIKKDPQDLSHSLYLDNGVSEDEFYVRIVYTNTQKSYVLFTFEPLIILLPLGDDGLLQDARRSHFDNNFVTCSPVHFIL